MLLVTIENTLDVLTEEVSTLQTLLSLRAQTDALVLASHVYRIDLL